MAREDFMGKLLSKISYAARSKGILRSMSKKTEWNRVYRTSCTFLTTWIETSGINPRTKDYFSHFLDYRWNISTTNPPALYYQRPFIAIRSTCFGYSSASPLMGSFCNSFFQCKLPAKQWKAHLCSGQASSSTVQTCPLLNSHEFLILKFFIKTLYPTWKGFCRWNNLQQFRPSS